MKRRQCFIELALPRSQLQPAHRTRTEGRRTVFGIQGRTSIQQVSTEWNQKHRYRLMQETIHHFIFSAGTVATSHPIHQEWSGMVNRQFGLTTNHHHLRSNTSLAHRRIVIPGLKKKEETQRGKMKAREVRALNQASLRVL